MSTYFSRALVAGFLDELSKEAATVTNVKSFAPGKMPGADAFVDLDDLGKKSPPKSAPTSGAAAPKAPASPATPPTPKAPSSTVPAKITPQKPLPVFTKKLNLGRVAGAGLLGAGLLYGGYKLMGGGSKKPKTTKRYE